MGNKNKQETPTIHLQTSAQVFVVNGEMEGVCVCVHPDLKCCRSAKPRGEGDSEWGSWTVMRTSG